MIQLFARQLRLFALFIRVISCRRLVRKSALGQVANPPHSCAPAGAATMDRPRLRTVSLIYQYYN